MTYIPDCRTDEHYNEKYLSNDNKCFLEGYDYAVEQILNLIHNNSEVYPELSDLLNYHKAIACVDKVKIVSDAIEEWAEAERDNFITAMIDGMDDTEYSEIKERVDGQGATEI